MLPFVVEKTCWNQAILTKFWILESTAHYLQIWETRRHHGLVFSTIFCSDHTPSPLRVSLLKKNTNLTKLGIWLEALYPLLLVIRPKSVRGKYMHTKFNPRWCKTLPKTHPLPPGNLNTLSAILAVNGIKTGNYLMTNQCKWIVNTAIDELSTTTNDRVIDQVIAHSTTNAISALQYSDLYHSYTTQSSRTFTHILPSHACKTTILALAYSQSSAESPFTWFNV